MDRNERIKAHGMNPDKVWYHGTGHDIKSFSHEFVGKGNDALGSGFYFTENPHVASGYAGGAEHDLQKKEMDNSNVAPNVLPVHLKLTKAVSHTKPLTRVQIGKIIKSAPNYKDSLYNFGDIDYEGEHRVLNDAVNSYKDLPSDRAMNYLHNDFYQGHAGEFLTNFVKHTGYDHIMNDNAEGDRTVVVFHPSQIRSVHARFDVKKMKSHDLSESFNIKERLNILASIKKDSF